VQEIASLAVLFLVVAALYSAVGHAGASGYLAVMALAGVAAATMRPAALALNLLVSVLGTWRFHRAGLAPWKTVGWLALGSVPAAFIAGGWPLQDRTYRALLGAVLLLSALYILWSSRPRRAASLAMAGAALPQLRPELAVPIGAGIGVLAGLTGTGGGIFLSPLLLLLGWRDVRFTAGAAAPFILVNSAAGLAGNLRLVGALPAELPWWLLAVGVGGWFGSLVGAQRLSQHWLRVVLAIVMAIASSKLLIG
jgi:uncharacterized membrane protein YfcA